MRQRRMLAPINTNKHYVHRTIVAVASGAIQSNPITLAVEAPATANAFNVESGSVVKAVHCEMWISGDEATDTNSSFTLIVEKLNGGGAAMTAANAANLGSYQNKKNILYTSQGNLAASIDGAQAVPVIRGWVLIPKGKQRQGLDDSIILHIAAVGSLKVCGLFTYKEYR